MNKTISQGEKDVEIEDKTDDDEMEEKEQTKGRKV